MSSVVRDSIEKYRDVLDETTEIKVELDSIFKAYLLAVYDITSQTGESITFLNPWSGYESTRIRLEKGKVIEFRAPMRGDIKELGTEPIKTPTELLEYLERKTSYNLGFGRLESAMNNISEILSDEKITEKMVKEKLKLIPR